MDFIQLSQYFEAIEATPSRLAMTDLLAKLLKTAGPEEAQYLCYLSLGRLGPRYDKSEFNLSTKLLIKSFGEFSSSIQDLYTQLGDVGLAVETFLNSPEKPSQSLFSASTQQTTQSTASVIEVFTKLQAIADFEGSGSQEAKQQAYQELILQLDTLSARYVTRIVLGKLRLGFSDKTIVDALSWMISGNKAHSKSITAMYQKATDIGLLAKNIKQHGLSYCLEHSQVQLGIPIEPALCQRLKTAQEMLDKMGSVVAEPKFDGTRVQIHWQRDPSMLKTFTRNLNDSTAMFPELNQIADEVQANSIILDAEGVGIDPETERMMLFQKTITRKRKHDISSAREEVPLRFFVFDILYKDGVDLLNTPQCERRNILEQTISSTSSTGSILQVADQQEPESAEALRGYHAELLEEGLEGAVVKKIDGPYQPGRSAYNWVKFKEKEGSSAKLSDTVDAVVMGYWPGEGKRAKFGIGKLLLGVRSEDTFVTVSRLGTGMTDQQLQDIKHMLDKHVVQQKPASYTVEKAHIPDTWVEPQIVMEVAGDELTNSSTHTAKVALRFPRLIKVRSDKSAQEATTVQELSTIQVS